MCRLLTSLVFIFLTALLFLSCEKESPVNPKANLPPKTFLWIQTDTTQNLTPVISRQVVRWWGEDPDGWIKGYLYAYYNADSILNNQLPDTVAFRWTTKNDTLISFPLMSAYERYTVFVRAVDNTFKEQLEQGAIVKLGSRPFWDKNVNGIFDEGDLNLNSLSKAIDPVGAKQIFPIKNSPPTVEFSKGPDPLDPINLITIQQPETTFTVATFSWVGSDFDGDHTLKAYRINLNNPNDSSAWFEFPSTNSMVTLEVPRSRSDNASGVVDADVYAGIFPTMRKLGTVSGLKLDDTNRIFLQAKDIAGEYSSVVSLPDGEKIWYVRKPKSQLLTVANYGARDYNTIISFYQSAFAAIDSFTDVSPSRNLGNFDILDIRRGTTEKNVGVLVPPIINPAFVRTLMLFKFVFWFTDYIPDTWAHVHSVAQFPLYLYRGAGGKILYTTVFGYYLGDPRGSLVDFAPVDRIVDTLYSTRVPNDWPIDPESSVDSFPRLRFNPTATVGGAHSIFVRDFIKQSGASYIYSVPPDTSITMPGTTMKWRKRVNIGVIDHDRRFVFFSMPIHLMNGYQRFWESKPPGDGEGVPALLKRVFIDEFDG
ncbi:MAG: hypothetical protein QME52_10435 [Bacteroidota bacterium]|nr:hypothetical protein [Bacteroidota bacterium]